MAHTDLRSARPSPGLGNQDGNCQVYFRAFRALENCRAWRYPLSGSCSKTYRVFALVSSRHSSHFLLAQSHVSQFVWISLCDYEFGSAFNYVDLLGSHDSRLSHSQGHRQMCHAHSNLANVCRLLCNTVGHRKAVFQSGLLGSQFGQIFGSCDVDGLGFSVYPICNKEIDESRINHRSPRKKGPNNADPVRMVAEVADAKKFVCVRSSPTLKLRYSFLDMSERLNSSFSVSHRVSALRYVPEV